MKLLGTAFLRGLAIVLPVLLTIYLVYFIANSFEYLMGTMLRLVIGPKFYWTGMGLAAAVIGVVLLGFATRLPGGDLLVRLSDAIFTRIPVLKSVYTTVRDLVGFISHARESGEVGKPVLVTMADGMELLGLVTDMASDLGNHPDKRVLVYLPMSYQIGGYMVSVPRDRVQALDMSVEDALRLAVTAGVRTTDSGSQALAPR